MAVLCLNFRAMGQQPREIKPLKIGDTIPEEAWYMPLQFVGLGVGKSTITLNQYRGKLIILDFWATWCSACMAAMPRVHQLQEQFNGQVQVLPITYEGMDKVLPLMEKNEILQKLRISSVVADTLFKQLFLHRVLPHYVWITADGRYYTATSAEQVTTENITKLLQQKSVGLRPKIDLGREGYTFLDEGLLRHNSILSYGLLFRQRFEGLPTGHQIQMDKQGNVLGISSTNLPLVELYEQAALKLFPKYGEKYHPHRKIVEVRERDRVVKDYTRPHAFNDTEDQYSYFSRGGADQYSAYGQMLAHLNRYTAYNGQLTKRRVRCLVLKRTGNINRVAKQHNGDKNSLFPDGGVKRADYPLAYLVSAIGNLKFNDLPVIDQTGYQGNIDLFFPAMPQSLQDLNDVLAGYHLKLSQEIRPLLMLVVEDKQNGVAQIKIGNHPKQTVK